MPARPKAATKRRSSGPGAESVRLVLRTVLNPTILTVAVVYGFATELAALAGLFGLLLWILVMLSLWRFCYALLSAFAHGTTNPPAPDVESTNPVGEIAPVLHAGVFFFAIVLLVTTPLLGDSVTAIVARVVGVVVLVAAFPGSAAVMGVTRNIGAALNPASVADVIGVLGRDYVKLIATLAVLVAAASIAASAAGASLAGGFLASVIATWAQLAIYATIGIAIHAHGDEFDLGGPYEQRARRDERERDRARQTQLDLAYASIRGGLVDQGYRTIRKLTEAEGESLEVHEWIFNRMFAWEDRSHAVAFAPRFIERLLEHERTHEALELAEQCGRVGGVRLELTEPAVGRLVEYARSIGRQRSADELAELAGTGGAASGPRLGRGA